MRVETAQPRVRQVSPLPANQTVSTLGRIDYEDAFVVDVGPTHTRRAEQWLRVILVDAPPTVRLRLLAGWSMIGLKLGLAGSSRTMLGWTIRAAGADFVLLGVESRIGMPGELLLRREEHQLLFATFVRQDNALARAVWSAVEPGHVRTVRSLLEHASRRSDP
jgi:hypothetical protein